MIPAIMLVCGLLVLFGIMFLVLKIYSQIRLNKLLHSKKIGTKETSSALLLQFGWNNVFIDSAMRHRNSPNRTKYFFDNIIVRKNGIFFVTTCPVKGKIIANDSNIWHQTYRTDYRIIENDFTSPVADAERKLPILYEIADEIQLNRKYIVSYVCMSSPAAAMNIFVENVYNLPDTIEYIYSRKLKKNLTLKQRNMFKRELKKRIKENRI